MIKASDVTQLRSARGSGTNTPYVVWSVITEMMIVGPGPQTYNVRQFYNNIPHFYLIYNTTLSVA